MANNGIETEVLKELKKRLVMKREEISDFLEKSDPSQKSSTDNIISELNGKGLIKYVMMIGKNCLAITQKGMRAIEET